MDSNSTLTVPTRGLFLKDYGYFFDDETKAILADGECVPERYRQWVGNSIDATVLPETVREAAKAFEEVAGLALRKEDWAQYLRLEDPSAAVSVKLRGALTKGNGQKATAELVNFLVAALAMDALLLYHSPTISHLRVEPRPLALVPEGVPFMPRFLKFGPLSKFVMAAQKEAEVTQGELAVQGADEYLRLLPGGGGMKVVRQSNLFNAVVALRCVFEGVCRFDEDDAETVCDVVKKLYEEVGLGEVEVKIAKTKVREIVLPLMAALGYSFLALMTNRDLMLEDFRKGVNLFELSAVRLERLQSSQGDSVPLSERLHFQADRAVARLVYAAARGEFHAREIAGKLKEDVSFQRLMVVLGGVAPEDEPHCVRLAARVTNQELSGLIAMDPLPTDIPVAHPPVAQLIAEAPGVEPMAVVEPVVAAIASVPVVEPIPVVRPVVQRPVAKPKPSERAKLTLKIPPAQARVADEAPGSPMDVDSEAQKRKRDESPLTDVEEEKEKQDRRQRKKPRVDEGDAMEVDSVKKGKKAAVVEKGMGTGVSAKKGKKAAVVEEEEGTGVSAKKGKKAAVVEEEEGTGVSAKKGKKAAVVEEEEEAVGTDASGKKGKKAAVVEEEAGGGVRRSERKPKRAAAVAPMAQGRPAEKATGWRPKVARSMGRQVGGGDKNWPNFPEERHEFLASSRKTGLAVYRRDIASSVSNADRLQAVYESRGGLSNDPEPLAGEVVKFTLYEPNDEGDMGENFTHRYDWTPRTAEEGTVMKQILDGVATGVDEDGLTKPLHMLKISQDERFYGDGRQSEAFVCDRTRFGALGKVKVKEIFANRSLLLYNCGGGDESFVESLDLMQNPDTLVEYGDGHLEQEGDKGLVVDMLRRMIPDPAFRNGRPRLNHLQNMQPNRQELDIPHLGALEWHQRAVDQTNTLARLPTMEVPRRHVRWGIAGNEGVKTEIHIDTGGHTYVIVKNKEGEKGWFSYNGNLLMGGGDGQTGNLRSRKMLVGWNSHGTNDKIMGWEAFWLGPGMTFVMRAGVFHRVVGMSDTVIRGGHGFSVAGIDRCIYADLHAILAGSLVTNTEHAEARWMYPRMLTHTMTRSASGSPDEHTLDLTKEPDLEKFALLVAFCAVLPALYEVCYEMEVPKDLKGSLPISRERLVEFEYVWARLGAFEDWIGDAFESDEEATGGISGVLEDAAVQMACCCVRYVESWWAGDFDEDEPEGSKKQKAKAKRKQPTPHPVKNFTPENVRSFLARSLAAFRHARQNKSLADFVYDEEDGDGLHARFLEDVGDKTKHFLYFLDWSQGEVVGGKVSHRPLTFRFKELPQAREKANLLD
ncbi:hypothetical protein C8F01DRAFT_1249460 [Mycena amicta]|nr:hypothetical protein C8F01DRAFT_1249460 [Mycena amicta]